MRRFTLRTTLALIALAALGMAAMRVASPLMVQAAFSAMMGALAVGLIGMIVWRKEPAWVGFAVFGWLYASLTFMPPMKDEFANRLLSTPAVEWAVDRIRSVPSRPEHPPFGFSETATNINKRVGSTLKKRVGSTLVALSPEEDRLVQSYRTQFFARQNAIVDEALYDRTRQIGTCLFGIVAAFMGGLSGRLLGLLAERRGRASESSH